MSTLAEPAKNRPVIFLKSKSVPIDLYEELLRTTPPHATGGVTFVPHFVPVLSFQSNETGLTRIRLLLQRRLIGAAPGCAYGGLIFTSQRAVEAFREIVDEGSGKPEWPHLHDVPIYSVGSATTRALNTVRQSQPLQVFGENTGNGNALAHFILNHYARWCCRHSSFHPLLFLVGEQRRNTIPRVLMDPSLQMERRIQVEEVVVYSTSLRESFFTDFNKVLRETNRAPSRWVIVFSPIGCDNMLRTIRKQSDMAPTHLTNRPCSETLIATIGPTTKAHLMDSLSFKPDVCAEVPSPEGILQAVLEFECNKMRDRRES